MFEIDGVQYNVEEPEAIWELFNSYWEQNDEEAFETLCEKVKARSVRLAVELNQEWYRSDSEDEDNYYDEEYEEEYGQYEKYTHNKKAERSLAKAGVGQTKRAGKKSQRDKWYGDFAGNQDAKDWFHRYGKKKYNGGRDIEDANEAKELYKKYLAEKNS